MGLLCVHYNAAMSEHGEIPGPAVVSVGYRAIDIDGPVECMVAQQTEAVTGVVHIECSQL